MSIETIMELRIEQLKEKYERGLNLYFAAETKTEQNKQAEINRQTDSELQKLLRNIVR